MVVFEESKSIANGTAMTKRSFGMSLRTLFAHARRQRNESSVWTGAEMSWSAEMRAVVSVG
jgi:hypothetical protein